MFTVISTYCNLRLYNTFYRRGRHHVLKIHVASSGHIGPNDILFYDGVQCCENGNHFMLQSHR